MTAQPNGGFTVRLALYQPDIAPNLGAAIRLAACFGVGLDVIEPCGFPLSDRALKRASLDYGRHVSVLRHIDLASFCSALHQSDSRLVAIETGGSQSVWDWRFHQQDVILLGRETAGLSEAALTACEAHLSIPMAKGARSLNVVNAGAVALGEATRQLGALAGQAKPD